MPKALRFLGWPVLVGVLLALLIIQHNPELVGLPRQEVHVEQAPLLSRLQEGPVSYANAVSRAARQWPTCTPPRWSASPPTPCSTTRCSAASSATTCRNRSAWSRASARR
ncbi:hypothetical protein P4233_04535 [Pseudomonas aeruginosa]|nr:hypothetical protein [Pseudomonas aeruginosa]